MVINEIFADPQGPTGDANGDGIQHCSDDEFIEIVNNGATPIDLSGWTLRDSAAIRHLFPGASVIQAGCAVVVFGGGTPTGSFGGATVQVCSTEALVLGELGDTVSLVSPALTTVATYTYGIEGGGAQSLTRSPDVTGSNPLVQHTSAAGSGGTRYSPGTKVDGTLFSGCSLTPTPSPTTSPSPTPSPTPFNNSSMLGNSIPSTMAPTQALLVDVGVRNTGNTTWTQADGYYLKVLSDPSGLIGAGQIDFTPSDVIVPFTNFQFLIQITAPGSAGPASISLRMSQSGTDFGATFNKTVQIEVPPNKTKNWAQYE